jgi:hypothetical protein
MQSDDMHCRSRTSTCSGRASSLVAVPHVPTLLETAGVTLVDGPFLDFRDPWGNRVEIVGYDNIQFTKAPNVLRGMGLMHLAKNEKAKKELAEKGMPLEYA